ncbi:MAG: terminase small subunit [Phenylobacterium sp.]|nr:terminase small subunit [Phenylobacterium sp.]
MSEQDDAAAADTLSDKQRQFVREYLIDLNATQAAIRCGYSPRTARQQAARLMTDVNISAFVREAMDARAARTEITADKVLQELWGIASADPSELVQFRRVNCRYCYGEGHRHQETRGERDRRHAQWERDREAAAGKPMESQFAVFDDLGGIGFDERDDPNPECPECHGEGQGRTFIADTRDVSPAARKLYAGVRETREGLEVKMHSKVEALTQVGRHLGMFTDKFEHGGSVAVTGGGVSGLLAAVTNGPSGESAPASDES